MRHRIVWKLSGFRSREWGAAAAEMALVIPLLLLLAVGVADYSRVFATGITVANAANAAAHYGVQSTTLDTAGTNLAGRQDGLDAGAITVASSQVCRCSDGTIVNCATATCGAYGSPQVFVVVTATKSVPLFFRYPGIPTSVDVSRSATLRAR